MPPPTDIIPPGLPSEALSGLAQHADETYLLPRSDKRDPFIETDYVTSMERAASLLNTHNDEGPLSKPEQ